MVPSHLIGSLARFQIGEASRAAAWAVCDALIDHEIAVATFDIKAALWAGNVELAKRLISKRMGLRIRPGDQSVKLKSPAAPMRAQCLRLVRGVIANRARAEVNLPYREISAIECMDNLQFPNLCLVCGVSSRTTNPIAVRPQIRTEGDVSCCRSYAG